MLKIIQGNISTILLYIFKKQVIKNLHSIIGILTVSFLAILSLVSICYFTGNSIGTFTKDPMALTDLPFYSGSFSQLGNMFWFIAAGISFFTFFISKGKYKKFLLFSAIFSLLLGMDDLFLIHDGLLPAIGLNENVMYFIYGIFTICYFSAFHKNILKTPFIILLMAFGFLGLSVISDLFKISGVNPFLFEDGFKMMGIISWMVYHFKVSKYVLEKAMQKQEMLFYSRGLESVNKPTLKKVAGD